MKTMAFVLAATFVALSSAQAGWNNKTDFKYPPSTKEKRESVDAEHQFFNDKTEVEEVKSTKEKRKPVKAEHQFFNNK